jgi:3-hydroxyisobutyrate dehydrogenase-like beta-hydroxyacid dehydrogenase
MSVALIGYGEVGRILAEDLRAQGVVVSAYDLKLDGADGQPLREHAARHGVVLAGAHRLVARGADLVVSAVTASQTVAVAEATAPGLQPGAFFLDFNSASPGAKVRAAGVVNGAGGRYVEGAVMTSVPPHRIRVPLLLGGPDAAALLPQLQGLGFAPHLADERLGIASATKMSRSVMIKGLEAMVIESFTTARHYGVEDALIASLRETFPGIDWESRPPTSSSVSSNTAAAAAKRCWRWPRRCAKLASRPGRPAAPRNARPGWPTWPMPACSATGPALVSRARPTGVWKRTASCSRSGRTE